MKSYISTPIKATAKHLWGYMGTSENKNSLTNQTQERLWTKDFILILAVNFLLFMNDIMFFNTFAMFIELHFLSVLQECSSCQSDIWNLLRGQEMILVGMFEKDLAYI